METGTEGVVFTLEALAPTAAVERHQRLLLLRVSLLFGTVKIDYVRLAVPARPEVDLLTLEVSQSIVAHPNEIVQQPLLSLGDFLDRLYELGVSLLGVAFPVDGDHFKRVALLVTEHFLLD